MKKQKPWYKRRWADCIAAGCIVYILPTLAAVLDGTAQIVPAFGSLLIAGGYLAVYLRENDAFYAQKQKMPRR